MWTNVHGPWRHPTIHFNLNLLLISREQNRSRMTYLYFYINDIKPLLKLCKSLRTCQCHSERIICSAWPSSACVNMKLHVCTGVFQPELQMCLLKVLNKCQHGSLWVQPAVITEHHHSLAVPCPAAAQRTFFWERESASTAAVLHLWPETCLCGWSWPTITVFALSADILFIFYFGNLRFF